MPDSTTPETTKIETPKGVPMLHNYAFSDGIGHPGNGSADARLTRIERILSELLGVDSLEELA